MELIKKDIYEYIEKYSLDNLELNQARNAIKREGVYVKKVP